MNYFRSLLIAIDQLGNAVSGGWPDETISCRAWRWHISGKRHWPARLINIMCGDRHHCHEAWLSEKRGRQLPPELRAPEDQRRQHG